jgi:excisionase family DNA binding protein
LQQARGVTVLEAASYLSTTVPAIRRLISKGELPYLKLGKRFIIDRLDLDKFIERRKHVV